ncbi:MAG: bifunctional nuclease family protein [Spirochaetales bacterium]|nr:bifunctional nuclease family protein [Spirochaetales bacterium]MBP7264078.1 bifunctional nuclease family protein [Spirochaetia bacterium]
MGSNTLVEADIWTVAQTEQGNVVLVRPKHSDVAVPIFIGQLETQAILIGLGRVDMPRPLTHDLFLSVLSSMGAALGRVEIHDLREGTFYARLIVETADGERMFDSRPSDAMALAVRCNAAVYIAESIVEEAGVPVDMVHEQTQKTDAVPEVSEERERVLKELDKAIADENYELAAELRDRLKKL